MGDINMNTEIIQKLELAKSLIQIIETMAAQGEDYFLIKKTYNHLIGKYSLPLPGIQYISNTEFKYVIAKKSDKYLSSIQKYGLFLVFIQ